MTTFPPTLLLDYSRKPFFTESRMIDILSFSEYDSKVGEDHLCHNRFPKAANVELGQNSTRSSSLVAKW